jgi:hypothetical protein
MQEIYCRVLERTDCRPVTRFTQNESINQRKPTKERRDNKTKKDNAESCKFHQRKTYAEYKDCNSQPLSNDNICTSVILSMKFFFKNENRSSRGLNTNAIRLDSSTMPASVNRGRNSTRLGSHDSRNSFTGADLTAGGANGADFRCKRSTSTWASSVGCTPGEVEERWLAFRAVLLTGISCRSTRVR